MSAHPDGEWFVDPEFLPGRRLWRIRILAAADPLTMCVVVEDGPAGLDLLLRTRYLIGRARAQFKDKRARSGVAISWYSDFSSDDAGFGGGSPRAC
jgi:hypothetical protein